MSLWYALVPLSWLPSFHVFSSAWWQFMQLVAQPPGEGTSSAESVFVEWDGTTTTNNNNKRITMFKRDLRAIGLFCDPWLTSAKVSILVEYGWDFWFVAVPPLTPVLKLGRTKWFQPRKESGLTRHFQADEMNRKPARNVWLWEFDFILVWNEFLFVQICRQRGFIYHPAFVRGKRCVTDRKIEAFATKRTLLYG